MLSPRVAVGIADRLYEGHNAEALRRKGLLDSCIVAVFVLHMLAIVGFIKLQEWEGTWVRVIRDVGVAFELTPPPVQEIVAVRMIPPPILKEGELAQRNIAPRIPARPESASSKSTGVKPVPPLATAKHAVQPVARTVPSAPISVTQLNNIKGPPPVPAVAEQVAVVPPLATSPGRVSTESEDGTSAVSADSAGTVGEQRGQATEITRILGPGVRGFNIAPYRKELLRRIALRWSPKGGVGNLTVLLRIAKDGKLISAELIQSSGKKKLDKQVLEAIRSTEFAPLPEPLKRDELAFKIDFSAVSAIESY